jgi:hypothetical protein
MDVISLVAGIIGIIAGLLGLFKISLEIRKQLQEDKSLSELVSTRRFRIALAIAIIGFALLIVAAWWATMQAPFVLTVEIRDVELDSAAAGKLIAINQFKGSVGNSIPNETLQQVGSWVIEQIEQRYPHNKDGIEVQVHVPADLNRENLEIKTNPTVPLKKYFWIVEHDQNSSISASKARIPMDKISESEESLKNLDKDFYIEITSPGYESETTHVNWSEGQDKNITLRPISLKIGIDEFKGDNGSVVAWLKGYLLSNSRLSLEIKDPSTLKELREKIEENRAFIAAHPNIQSNFRTSLGIDLIISGNYEKT